MGEESPSHHYIDAKWDAAIDTSLRRFVYGSLAGGAVALLLFRGPSSRTAVMGLGAGFGLGTAYQQNQTLVSIHL